MKFTAYSTFFALLLALTATVGAESATGGLKDQFGQPGGLEAYPGEVRLAIVVTAKRLRRLKPWEEEIRQHYPDLPIIRVADVPRTAPTEYDSVAAKLKKRLPEDLPVLIDLQGSWAEQFGLDVAVPNLLIFNADGELISVHAGMYKPARFIALQTDLDSVLPVLTDADAESAD